MKMYKKNIFIISIILIILFSTKTISPKNTKAEDIETNENTEMIYYIDVKHHTFDINGYIIDDDDIINDRFARSDYIFVEDKLPFGLEFEGFVTTLDGSIGAYNYDSGQYCDGYVINDTNDEKRLEGTWNNDHTEYTYHGLHYNAITRKISFIVDDLTPECNLKVGVVVETPTLEVGQSRLDFYNIAQAINSKYAELTDIIHHFIENETTTLYTVNYIDNEGYSLFSSEIKYSSGTEVSVPLEPNYYGYKFDGWTSDDVTITDGKFTMPSQDIEIVANYSEEELYSVTYSIEGDIPEDFTVPSTILAYPGEIIKYPITKGMIINGYEFQGWEVTGATFGDDTRLVMPENNVSLVGRFVEKEYTITYKFNYDNEIINEVLPSQEKYKAGELVVLPGVTEKIDADNSYKYIFYGWKSDEKFLMPEKDLTIYGNWVLAEETHPTVTLSLCNDHFIKPGDDVLICATLNSDVNNVYYKIDTNLKYIYYPAVYDNNEELITDEYFDNIKNNSYFEYYNFSEEEIKYVYHVNETDRVKSKVKFKFSQVYRDGEDDIQLTPVTLSDSDTEYELELDIVPRFMLCSKSNTYINEYDIPPVYKITGENGVDIKVPIKNGCQVYFLTPGQYKVKQVLPFIYKNISVSGIIDSDNTEFTLDGADDEYLLYNYGYKDIRQELPYLYTNHTWVQEMSINKVISEPCINEGEGIPYLH